MFSESFFLYRSMSTWWSEDWWYDAQHYSWNDDLKWHSSSVDCGNDRQVNHGDSQWHDDGGASSMQQYSSWHGSHGAYDNNGQQYSSWHDSRGAYDNNGEELWRQAGSSSSSSHWPVCSQVEVADDKVSVADVAENDAQTEVFDLQYFENKAQSRSTPPDPAAFHASAVYFFRHYWVEGVRASYPPSEQAAQLEKLQLPNDKTLHPATLQQARTGADFTWDGSRLRSWSWQDIVTDLEESCRKRVVRGLDDTSPARGIVACHVCAVRWRDVEHYQQIPHDPVTSAENQSQWSLVLSRDDKSFVALRTGNYTKSGVWLPYNQGKECWAQFGPKSLNLDIRPLQRTGKAASSIKFMILKFKAAETTTAATSSSSATSGSASAASHTGGSSVRDPDETRQVIGDSAVANRTPAAVVLEEGANDLVDGPAVAGSDPAATTSAPHLGISPRASVYSPCPTSKPEGDPPVTAEHKKSTTDSQLDCPRHIGNVAVDCRQSCRPAAAGQTSQGSSCKASTAAATPLIMKGTDAPTVCREGGSVSDERVQIASMPTRTYRPPDSSSSDSMASSSMDSAHSGNSSLEAPTPCHTVAHSRTPAAPPLDTFRQVCESTGRAVSESTATPSAWLPGAVIAASCSVCSGRPDIECETKTDLSREGHTEPQVLLRADPSAELRASQQEAEQSTLPHTPAQGPSSLKSSSVRSWRPCADWMSPARRSPSHSPLPVAKKARVKQEPLGMAFLWELEFGPLTEKRSPKTPASVAPAPQSLPLPPKAPPPGTSDAPTVPPASPQAQAVAPQPPPLPETANPPRTIQAPPANLQAQEAPPLAPQPPPLPTEADPPAPRKEPPTDLPAQAAPPPLAPQPPLPPTKEEPQVKMKAPPPNLQAQAAPPPASKPPPLQTKADPPLKMKAPPPNLPAQAAPPPPLAPQPQPLPTKAKPPAKVKAPPANLQPQAAPPPPLAPQPPLPPTEAEPPLKMKAPPPNLPAQAAPPPPLAPQPPPLPTKAKPPAEMKPPPATGTSPAISCTSQAPPVAENSPPPTQTAPPSTLHVPASPSVPKAAVETVSPPPAVPGMPYSTSSGAKAEMYAVPQTSPSPHPPPPQPRAVQAPTCTTQMPTVQRAQPTAIPAMPASSSDRHWTPPPLPSRAPPNTTAPRRWAMPNTQDIPPSFPDHLRGKIPDIWKEESDRQNARHQRLLREIAQGGRPSAAHKPPRPRKEDGNLNPWTTPWPLDASSSSVPEPQISAQPTTEQVCPDDGTRSPSSTSLASVATAHPAINPAVAGPAAESAPAACMYQGTPTSQVGESTVAKPTPTAPSCQETATSCGGGSTDTESTPAASRQRGLSATASSDTSDMVQSLPFSATCPTIAADEQLFNEHSAPPEASDTPAAGAGEPKGLLHTVYRGLVWVLS